MSESNIRSLLRILLAPVQDAEDMLQDLLRKRGIETATGAALDLIGKIVKQPRAGRADAIYRRFLRARVATLRSSGTGEDLIKVAVSALSGIAGVRVFVDTQGIAAVVVHLESAPVDADTAAALLELLKKAKAGGVRLMLDYSTVVDASTFTLARSAHAAGALSAGATTIAVDSTAAFPATGTLTIDANVAVAEAVGYTIGGPTSFALDAALTHNHDNRASITIQDPALGFGSGHLRWVAE